MITLSFDGMRVTDYGGNGPQHGPGKDHAAGLMVGGLAGTVWLEPEMACGY